MHNYTVDTSYKSVYFPKLRKEKFATLFKPTVLTYTELLSLWRYGDKHTGLLYNILRSKVKLVCPFIKHTREQGLSQPGVTISHFCPHRHGPHLNLQRVQAIMPITQEETEMLTYSVDMSKR